MTLSAAKLALAIKRLRSQVDDLEVLDREPIAIIGMACRFPGGADSPAEFWRLLEEGRDAIGEMPQARWHPDALPKNGRLGAFLPAIDGFDPEFFGIAPREAEFMDPQQRLLLEVAWEALWDAGIAPSTLAGTDTGVFAALCSSDYARLQLGDPLCTTAHTSSGVAHSVAAGRISFLLDLRGPSIAVDTACSSSLTAVHMACQSLRRQESGTAIVGACSLKVLPDEVGSLIKLGMIGADGRSKAFDQRADGFGLGEGCGVLVLKRLTDALANGDRVLAVIRGTALNQDGRSSVLTAPNGVAQRAVLRAALENAQVEPGDVGYIETHGTGTPLGDPIEVEALAEVLGRGDRPCFLSSVKTNIGHLEAAAGMAGLIKTVLCLQHERIPRHLHFTGLNPQISFEETRFRIPVEAVDWPRNGSPRFAGVSSFGFSGTNGHVIVEEAPVLRQQARTEEESLRMLPVSAKTEKALREFAAAYANRAEALSGLKPAPLLDLCYTAGACRSHYEERLAVLGTSAAEISEQLRRYADGQNCPAIVRGRKPHGSLPGLVFVFSGQGSQWAGMGRELMVSSKPFRTAMEECDALLAPLAGWSLIEKLSDAAELDRTDVAQPAIFAIQVSLARLWRHWGIVPDAVAGHSVGEIAAAHIAGVLTLGEAMRIAYHRSLLMQRATGFGRMAAVRLSAAEAEREIDACRDRLSIAAVNAPESVVISGETKALEEVTARLSVRGVRVQPLGVNYAFHSPQMDALREELIAALGKVSVSPAAIPIYSTVTGVRAEAGDFNAQYWARNMREPVRLQQAVDALIDAGCRTFVEIGPHAVLGGPLSECVEARQVQAMVTASMRRQSGMEVMLRSAGALYCEGRALDFAPMYAGGEVVSLPHYPWQRQRCWVSDRAEQRDIASGRLEARLLTSPAIRGKVFEFELHSEMPFLCGHRIHGEAMLPFTGYLYLLRKTGATVLDNVVVHQPLRVADGAQVKVQVTIDGDEFAVHSLAGDAWVKHAEGRVTDQGASDAFDPLQAGTAVSAEYLYERLRAKGIEYGDEFCRVEALFAEGDTATGRARLEEEGPEGLDACLQPVWGVIGLEGNAMYAPTIAGSVRFAGEVTGEVVSHVRLTARTANGVTGDVRVVNAAGAVLFEVRGLHLRRLEPRAVNTADLLYELVWREAERGPLSAAHGNECFALSGDRPFEQYEQVLENGGWRAVVYVANGSEEACSHAILRTVQTLVRMGQPPRLWLMTRGELKDSPLWGFARTIALEHPELRCSLAEVEEGEQARFVEEVSADLDEPVVAFRGGKRYVGRLERRRTNDGPVKLAIPSPGVIENLALVRYERREPGPREIEIRVLATGLNFRDVLGALGMYPGGVDSVGGECAGVVERVGVDVKELQPGDAVMAFGPGSFASFITVPAEYAARKPEGMTFAAAAGMPVAFLTAKYGLHRLARMKQGDRVLIHAATGGVGLAAVQLAQRAGAEVYATAGSEHKREYLKRLGVRHVFDSRSTAFARGIEVDIVLNSLSGDFIAAGLSALAKGGRFIELGKRGIWTAEQVAAARGDVEYFAFDLAEVGRQNPGILRDMFAELFAVGVQPLPVATYELEHTDEAFRTMSQARHTGKLVVMHANRALATSAAVRSDGTYLITGGLGALGLETAKWLASRGARSIVLAGRKAPSARAVEAIEELRACGVSVEVRSMDVAKQEDVRALIDGIPALRGIVHAAGVLDDSVLVEMDWERARKVMEPKIAGAMNLDRATENKPLDFFILYSSVASFIGSAGQTAYAAANAFLDALARQRRKRGLAGLSVNWGAWAESGMAASLDRRHWSRWERSGMELLQPAEAFAALEALLDSTACQAAVMKMRWEEYLRETASRSDARLFTGLVREEIKVEQRTSDLVARLEAAPANEQRGLLLAHLKGHARHVLGLSAGHPIDSRQPLQELGLDSLMAVEFRNALAQDIGKPLSATLLFDYPAVADLAEYLLTNVLGESKPAKEAPDAELQALAAISDSEAEMLLIKELEAGVN